MMGLPELLILRLVHTGPPAIHQLQLRFSTLALDMVVSGRESLPWEAVAPCVHLCLSNLGGSSWPYVFPSLTNPRRVVDFSVCSAFYLLGQSGNFQTPDLWNPISFQLIILKEYVPILKMLFEFSKIFCI